MNFVAVLPSIYPLWTQRCVRTMGDRFIQNTLTIHNEPPNDNLGVAASWNLGIDDMQREDADWLVIVSAATRFGYDGGQSFLSHVEMATDNDPPVVAVEAGHGVGWHLIAFPRFVIEAVGEFDENFFAYMEDNDYARRISLAFGLDPPYWHKTTDLDISIAGFAHGIDLAGVRPNNNANLKYYVSKWGGLPGGFEKFPTPFNDFDHGVDWWPTPPDTRSVMEDR